MSLPTVTAILPCRDRTTYLAEALDSILQQDYAGAIEIIVVDDGSDEPISAQFAARYPMVRFLRQAPAGLPQARQAGSEAASGFYLAYQDDDDIWRPDKISRLVAFLQRHPGVPAVFGDIACFRDRASRRYPWFHHLPRFRAARHPSGTHEGDWIYPRGALIDPILLEMPPFAQTLLIERRFLQQIGGWEPSSRLWSENYAINLRASHAAPIGFLDDIVVEVRRGHDHATKDLHRGRLEESLDLLRWGLALRGEEVPLFAPRLARRFTRVAYQLARAGWPGRSLRVLGFAARMFARAPWECLRRPWRHAVLRPAMQG